MSNLNRRDFLKAAGVSGAAVAAAGCTDLPGPLSWDPRVPIENVLPYVALPDQIIPGLSTWFATKCNECPAGCGVLARNREGRVVKLEGNPEHPTNLGKLCSRGQAGLQATYSPDRYTGPMVAGAKVAEADATAAVVTAIQAAQAGGKKVAWLGKYRTGTLAALLRQFAGAVGGTTVLWEPLGRESLRSAGRAAFGMDAIPSFKLDDAHTIVSFGADFLGTWGETISLTRGYANSRDPSHGGFVSRLVCVEPRVGTTAAMSDLHLAAIPGAEVAVALALASLVATARSYSGPAAGLVAGLDAAALASQAGVDIGKLQQTAAWMAEASSVVLPSGTATSSAASALDTAVLLLNEVAGNIGTTVVFGNHPNTEGFSTFADVKALLDDCKAGNVGVLFLDELDIVHGTPVDAGAREALASVGQLVVFTNEPSDSLNPKAIVLPPGTTLETWGDGEEIFGRYTLQQPTMKPIHQTRSVGDTLLAVAKGLGLQAAPEAVVAPVTAPTSTTSTQSADGSSAAAAAPPPAPVGPRLDAATFHDYLAARWVSEIWTKAGSSATPQAFWTSSLQKGGFFQERPGTGATFQLGAAPSSASVTPDGAGVVVALFPHPFIYDGRHANKPWAQEIPEPLSSFTWGTWVEIHPETAEKLGLSKDDGVTVQTAQGEIEVGWFAYPGIRKDVIGLVMGNGHEASGRYTRFGKNPLRLIPTVVDSASGALSYVSTRGEVKRSGKPSALHPYLGSFTMEGRGINYVVSKDDLGKGDKPASIVPIHEVPVDERLIKAKLTDMYPEPDHPTYRFAMAFDLNRCTGCGACEAACYAENNLAVVGPEQIKKSRHMGWIRLSRYWEGGDDHPDVRFQPTMCQHCSHAPCEGVCPVLATYHNLDGLNAMIYNRCVGTRYCGNNCPYTARRFNYHSFKWPESFNLMLNPDVSTREMGVMEKCTFCVQRLREAKDTYRDRDHAVVPNEALRRITACAQACPADAITFGNVKDGEGEVHHKFQDERAYTMLGELNTKPGVRYLARIHHNPSKLHHGGGHGGDAEHSAPAGEAHGHKAE